MSMRTADEACACGVAAAPDGPLGSSMELKKKKETAVTRV